MSLPDEQIRAQERLCEIAHKFPRNIHKHLIGPVELAALFEDSRKLAKLVNGCKGIAGMIRDRAGFLWDFKRHRGKWTKEARADGSDGRYMALKECAQEIEQELAKHGWGNR